MSGARRNVAVLIGATVLYYVWWRVADPLALARPEANDLVDPVMLHAVVDATLGFGLYFAFLGSRTVRIWLAALVAFLVGVLLEVTSGSDLGYPISIILTATLMALVFAIGALTAAGVHTWHKRRPTVA